jgi:predicted NBD/HSP70 family sugar kinase
LTLCISDVKHQHVGAMKYFLALDIGGTFTKITVLENGKQCFKDQFKSISSNDAPSWWQSLFKNIEDSLAKGKQTAKLNGIGLALPVTFNYKTYQMFNSPNMKILANRYAKQDCQDFLPQKWSSLPLTLMNDADAVGVAIAHEFKQKNCAVFTLGTGCGGSLILNNQLWIGDNHYGSEVGHMLLDPDPIRRCKCGKVGCVEAHLGEFGLGITARKLFPKKLLPYDHIGKALVKSAHEGDEESKLILIEYGHHIGLTIASITNLMGIQSFFLYGGISRGFETFSPGIQTGLQEGRFAFDINNITIQPLPTDKDYAALGLYLFNNSQVSRSE